MTIRCLHREDQEAIKNILTATEMFSAEEIAIAGELMQFYLDDPKQQDYELFTSVDENGNVLGYVCIGPTPATAGTFDLYWIAVQPSTQSRGVGTALLSFVEERLKKKEGRLLIAETSATQKYERTRAFYERKGFVQLARIHEYYKPGDDLIIYGKYLITT
ncbi:MAG: GNAT family N-acetyltransferase [Bacteroidota bacterium]|nr:GNAT family N-acetyltransferase [Bacteroidota bacterium]